MSHRQARTLFVPLFLVACAPALESGPELARPDTAGQAIINGKVATVDQHPSSVGLMYAAGGGVPWQSVYAGPFCSGTLIAPDVVLTAAHCVSAREEMEAEARSAGGTARFFASHEVDLNQNIIPDDAIQIVGWEIHPSYSGDSRDSVGADYDIGMVYLDHGDEVHPAVVAGVDELDWIRVAEPVATVGWGRTIPTSDFATGVKGLIQTRLHSVTPLLLGIGFHPDEVGGLVHMICNGDSGGPTYLRAPGAGGLADRVIGVSSRGLGVCADGAVLTRVDAHRDWILDAAQAACDGGVRTVCDQGALPPAPDELPTIRGGPAIDPLLAMEVTDYCASLVACGVPQSPDMCAAIYGAAEYPLAGDCPGAVDDSLVTFHSCLLERSCSAISARQACSAEFDALQLKLDDCSLPPLLSDDQIRVAAFGPDAQLEDPDAKDDDTKDEVPVLACGSAAAASPAWAALAGAATMRRRRRRIA